MVIVKLIYDMILHRILLTYKLESWTPFSLHDLNAFKTLSLWLLAICCRFIRRLVFKHWLGFSGVAFALAWWYCHTDSKLVIMQLYNVSFLINPPWHLQTLSFCIQNHLHTLNAWEYERRYGHNNTCFLCFFCLIAAIMMIILVITLAYAIEAFWTYKDPVSLFTIQYPSDWKTVGEKVGHVTFMPQSIIKLW